jgi:hypothetical protein
LWVPCIRKFPRAFLQICGSEVPSLASETQRHIPYVFDKPQGNAEDKRAAIANITTPMSDSVTFIKMLKKQVGPVQGWDRLQKKENRPEKCI